jgi:hypothetical protein
MSSVDGGEVQRDRSQRMRVGVLGALSLFALIGCGSDAPPPRTLTGSDITPIPPGTAIGSYFSGDYEITSGHVEACRCRVGNCATVHVLIGNVLRVTQTDGMIQISNPTATEVCSGGVDSDGSFRCNGEVMQSYAVEFAVATGQFVFSSGAASSFHQTEEVTLMLPAVDCDIRGFMATQFIGGLPTALVEKSSAANANGDAAVRSPGLLGFAVGP